MPRLRGDELFTHIIAIDDRATKEINFLSPNSQIAEYFGFLMLRLTKKYLRNILRITFIIFGMRAIFISY